MPPMRGRVSIECHQRLAVFDQGPRRLQIFGLAGLDELVERPLGIRAPWELMAPSPTANSSAFKPRARKSNNTSRQLCVDSRSPSSIAGKCFSPRVLTSTTTSADCISPVETPFRDSHGTTAAGRPTIVILW